MKNYTHHFEIDGLDVYAYVHYEEGQESDYFEGIPYIAPAHYVDQLWIGDQEVQHGSVFDEIEERIQEELSE
jgi:hypothetical protein